MYDAGTRAKARTIAEARGISAAATITGVGRTTLKRWARQEGWRTRQRRAAAAPDHPATVSDPVAPAPDADVAQGKSEAAPSGREWPEPMQGVAGDADLTRRAFRQQLQDFMEGRGRPGWVRDLAIAHGIMLDKQAKHGGSEPWRTLFPPENYPADGAARVARITSLLDVIEARHGTAEGDRPG
jgi:hypothetical protein